jgi:hypothetical protein
MSASSRPFGDLTVRNWAGRHHTTRLVANTNWRCNCFHNQRPVRCVTYRSSRKFVRVGGPGRAFHPDRPVRVLPTEAHVEAMLRGTSHAPGKIVGRMQHSGAQEAWEFDVEKVAVNAVMAGAAPKHFPVILALASSNDTGRDARRADPAVHADAGRGRCYRRQHERQLERLLGPRWRVRRAKSQQLGSSSARRPGRSTPGAEAHSSRPIHLLK